MTSQKGNSVQQKKTQLPEEVQVLLKVAREKEDVYRCLARLSKEVCLKVQVSNLILSPQDEAERGADMAQALIDLGVSDSGVLARACAKLGEADRAMEAMRGGFVSNLVETVHRPSMQQGEGKMAQIEEKRSDYKQEIVRAKIADKNGAVEERQSAEAKANEALRALQDGLQQFQDETPMHRAIELLARETKIFFDGALEQFEALDGTFD